MKRKQPTLKEKYAAALLHLEAARCQLDPTLQTWVDREKLKAMSASEACKAIIAAHEVDHWPTPVAWGGDNHPTNLNPLVKATHREKTNKKDIKEISKTKRIARTQKFVVKKPDTLTPASQPYIEAALPVFDNRKGKKKWPSRPMDGTIASGKKRGMNGKVSRRS
jgi:hypothetical protein